VDLDAEARLHTLLARAVGEGLLETAHDVSNGGLAVALAECCFTAPDAVCVGAQIELEDGIRPDALLFGESTGRVIAATSDADGLCAAARDAGVPARRIGVTGGDRLTIGSPGAEPWIERPVAALRELWSRALPRRLEAE
jgi:phosphoribosylformylglycinamidine synthase